MKSTENINEIATALAKAQGEMRPAIKNAVNPHFKSKFSDLTAILDSIREPLAVNGLCVLQEAITVPEGIGVTTRIIHKSGQWIECGPIIVPLGRKDAHGIGSATSYAKRYGICAALAIVSDEDDDGNAAVSSAEAQQNKVNQHQINQLNIILDKVPEYKQSVLMRLQKEFGFADLSLLPKNSFDLVLHTARESLSRNAEVKTCV